jgi:ribosomal protein L34
MQPPGSLRTADSIIEEAREQGFELARFSTATGQTVWEWRRGDEPRPQFATERVAIVWMTEWLERPERPES